MMRQLARLHYVAAIVGMWACLATPAPSTACPICGNGAVESGEECDDDNTAAGDGCCSVAAPACDPTCSVEQGWSCVGSPSVCTPVCGDGLVRGSEGCDDGNTSGGDGCSSTCQTELALVPNEMAIVVDEVREVQVFNYVTGAMVTGVTITSDAPSIATTSSGTTYSVTGVAAGSTMIRVGGASAHVTVFAGPTLPPGTLRWVAPSDGSGFLAWRPLIPGAAPIGSTHMFTLESSGRVQALRSDGTLVWQSTVGGAPSGIVPDMSGGVLAIEETKVTRVLDGATAWVYEPAGASLEKVVVHSDGTIVMLREIEGSTTLVGLSPNGGGERFSVSIPSGTYSRTATCDDPGGGGLTQALEPLVSRIAIDEHGTIHVAYLVESYTELWDLVQCNTQTTTVRTLNLLAVDAAGSGSSQALYSWTGTRTSTYNASTFSYDTTDDPAPDISFGSTIVPSSAPGVLLGWNADTPLHYPVCTQTSCPSVPAEYQGMLTHASGAGVQSEGEVPDRVLEGPMVAGQSGRLFTRVIDVTANEEKLAALTASGTVLWEAAGQYVPVVALADGSVVTQVPASSTVTTFDVSGVPSSQSIAQGIQYSWSADLYGVYNGAVCAIDVPPLGVADSSWYIPDANPSGTCAATPSVN